jgi:uncharacterized protein YidB (DUF937 family)
MGLLDTVMNMAERHPEVNQQQHSGLVQGALSMLSSPGGISGLLNNAQSTGLGGIVQSWIATGANQPINESQVQSVLGQDRINELASRAGIPPAVASAALTRILPMIVDKLTPHGRPEAA